MAEAARPDPRRHLGAEGEAQARTYLIARGYRILAANWRCDYGELDLVAQQGETIVIVEVRTRRAGTDAAFESITPTKRDKLLRLSQAFLAAHDLDDMPCRIDVIGVRFGRDGRAQIAHAEDALGW